MQGFDIHYLFDDMAHLRFARTKITTYVGLPVEMAKIGSDESVGLMIFLSSGEEIKLTETPGWVFSSKVNKHPRHNRYLHRIVTDHV